MNWSAVRILLLAALLLFPGCGPPEEGAAADLFKNPKSDYTRALFAAAFKLEAAFGDVVEQ